MIFTRRLFYLIALTCLIPTVVGAQRQTKMDLRKHGRIIAGPSLTFLLTDEDEKKKQTPDLRKKLGDRRGLRGVVVPETLTENKPLIGLISYDGLPYDEEVSSSDFSYLQNYAGNDKRAALTEKYEDITVSVSIGVDIRPAVAEINAMVADSSATDSVKLYAGYLLGGLANTSAIADLRGLVDNYRRRTERNLVAIIDSLLTSKSNEWEKPFRFGFGEPTESLTIDDLRSGQIVRGTGSTKSYLMIWNKRSLVIIPEKPDKKFDPATYAGPKDYVLKAYPSLHSDMYVTNINKAGPG